MAFARRLYINPADNTQRYILYSNGYIQPLGNAVPIEQDEGSVNNYAAQKAPTFYAAAGSPDQAVALFITNWSTPAGYTLTFYGHVWAWGGAAVVPGAPPGPLTGAPEYLFGTSGGFPSPDWGFVSDFVMDPAGNGKGLFLTYDGMVTPFGTGQAGVGATPFLAGVTVGVRLVMNWSTKQYWVHDRLGRVAGGNPTNVPNVGSAASWGGILPGWPNFVWGRGANVDLAGGLVLYDQDSTPHGFTNDLYGRAYPVGGALEPTGFPFNPGLPIWEDIAIVDDGTGVNPLRLAMLDRNGGVYEWVVSTAPTVTVMEPVFGSTVTTSTRPWVSWSYLDRENNPQTAWQLRVLSSAVFNAVGTDEVQRVTITGTPTGGTFTLTVPGVGTTGAIARNATAGNVQTALEAILGVGNVTCGGGALPGAFVTVTFTGAYAKRDMAQMTAVGSFTGGSSPAVAVTTTTAGVDVPDPSALSFVWQASGVGLDTRRTQIGTDLANTAYRAYMRVTDSSGLQSAWSYTHWTQTVTPPATPTVTPTAVPASDSVSLLLHVNPSGLSASARFAVQYHDSDWVLTYIYDTSTDSWVASAWSSTATGVLSATDHWALTNPGDPTEGGRIEPDENLFVPTRPIVSMTLQASGRDDPIVVSDGKPKYPAGPFALWRLSSAERLAIDALLDSDTVMLLRDTFGRAWYCRAVSSSSVATDHRASGSRTDEVHKASLTLQTVKRPWTGPTVGPLAET
jgi:hypothetical protein